MCVSLHNAKSVEKLPHSFSAFSSLPRNLGCALDLLVQPGPRIAPPALGAGGGYAQRLGGLIDRTASEKTQFYQRGLRAVLRGEFGQRLIDSQQGVIVRFFY